MGGPDLGPEGIYLLHCEMEWPGETNRVLKGGRRVEAVGRIKCGGSDIGGCAGETLAKIVVIIVRLSGLGIFPRRGSGSRILSQVMERRVEKNISIGRVGYH